MSLYKRGGLWWVYVVHDGRRFRRSTGESRRAVAQRIHDEFRAELWKRRARGAHLHGALDAWAKGRVGPDLYRVGILKARLADRPLADLRAEDVEAQLPDSTPGTFNRYANLVTAAWNLARGREPDLPALRIARRRAPKGRVRWLTRDEWERLRAALPPGQRPMAEFAIATGLRQANVLRLEWSQVDLRRKLAWIHADQAKSREPLGVPLSEEAMRVLRAQLGRSERWVFPGRTGEPVTEVKTGWSRAVKSARVAPFRWHDLRHTWATWHVMGGTPLEVLKQLGGWADLRMVLRYAHLAESHVAQFAGNARPYQPRRAKKAA